MEKKREKEGEKQVRRGRQSVENVMENFHTLVRIHPEQLALYVYTLYFLIDAFIRCFFSV